MSSYKIYTSEINILDNNDKKIVGSIYSQGGKVKINNLDINAATNVIYNDDWFRNLMINQPPTPTLISNGIRNPSNIGIIFEAPEQINFGAMLVPYIDNINISIGGTGGISETNIFINNKAYIPLSDTPIEGIVLSKTLATGYYENFSHNSIIKPTYVYNQNDFSNFVVNDKITLNIWYKNSVKTVNKSSLNILSIDIDNFPEASPPSVVRDIQINNISTTTATVSYTAPEFSNDTQNEFRDNSVSINQYKIEYSSLSTDRFVYYPNNGNIETGNNSLSYNLSNLAPGTRYSISVKAQNQLNINYGPQESITFYTLNPPPIPVLPNSISLVLPTSHYYNNIKKFSSKQNITNPIYKESNNIGRCENILNLPIHTEITMGSGNSNLSNLTFEIDNDIQSSVSFDGFKNNNSSRYNITNSSNNKATFEDVIISDSYAGTSTYFYSKISSITPKINGVFSFKSDPYNCNITYNINNTDIIGNSIFYIDTLNQGPTGNVIYVSDSILTKKVTGMEIGGSYSFQNIVYDITVNNIGYGFYRSDKIIETNITNVIISNPILNDIPNSITGETLPNSIDMSHTLNMAFIPNTIHYGISFTPKIYNYYTVDGSSYTCNPISINKFIDCNSYNKSFVTSVQYINNTYTNPLRIETPISSFDNAIFNQDYTIFDNDKNLITEYTNELPILKGLYSTGKNDANYFSNLKNITGLDYTNINTSSEFRYVSFVWEINKNINKNIGTIRLLFQNFINDTMLYNFLSNVIEGDSIQIYYRLEQYDNIKIYTPGEIIPNGINNYSTVWVNALSNENIFFQSTFINPQNNKTVTGLIKSQDFNINNPNSSNFILNLRGFNFNPSSLPTDMKIRIYSLIKVKMQSNISFENVKCDYNIF
jgi:hypothetical protein